MRYFHYCRKSTDDDDHQVASLESQREENERRFLALPGIEIVNTYDEARSARTPGRPIFNDLLDRIERGEADGLLAWHPDRLARNSIDGGRIIYLLDCGKLKDLKFSTYTFENTPQGKFMLQIVFANSKYYVDSLSENVSRGIRTKILKGWLSNRAPLGYLNGDETTPVIEDPDRFPIVQRMWHLALTGTYSVRQIRDIAADKWGLRTRKTKKQGGGELTLSGAHALFKSPFYAGLLSLKGRTYPGKHKAMVTVEQFKLVQRLISRKSNLQPQVRTWAYTGMIRCGTCGLAVTAEEKVKRSGRKYVYYHCTKRRGREVCREPYAPLATIEAEIERLLERITISDELHAFAMAHIDQEVANVRTAGAAAKIALGKARDAAETSLRNLRVMRVKEQINDDEYMADRQALEKELIGINRQLATDNPEEAFEPARAFVTFSNRALKWFREGDLEMRRLIFETIGSTPLLKGKKLNLDARFPFRVSEKPIDFLLLCAVVHDIRTHGQDDSLAKLRATVDRLKHQPIRYRGSEALD